MPRKRHPGRWPRKFYLTLLKVVLQGRTTIHCDTHREARNLRAQYYAFRDSVRDADGWEQLTPDLLDQLTFTLDGADLIIRNGAYYA